MFQKAPVVHLAPETFAAISFQSYKKAGFVTAPTASWLSLPFEERKVFMDEAKYFMTMKPVTDWPIEIQEFLKEEGFFI